MFLIFIHTCVIFIYTPTCIYVYVYEEGRERAKGGRGKREGKHRGGRKKWKENTYEGNVNISEIWMKDTKDYSYNLF